MPQSPDEPPSTAPAGIVEGNEPDASPPSASDEKDSSGSGPANAAGQLTAAHHPGRRRRRRHRPPQPPTEPVANALTEQLAPAVIRTPNDGPPGISPGAAESHRPPRRRRRRRRGPPRDDARQNGAGTGNAEAENNIAAADASLPPPLAAEGGVGGADPGPSLPEQASPARADTPHKSPRPRLRRYPREASRWDANASTDGQEASHAVEGGGQSPIGGSHTDRPRNRRPRRAHLRDSGSQDPGVQDRPARSAEARRPGGRRSERLERRAGPRRQRERGTGDRHRGRGREAPPKKPEQKLYALESVVDRGFQDVVDEAEESATRRVHWTIIKRTVADQKSGKPMSAVYVLQREGTDAEFPNLGAARAAVNKTIVHPEKLTMSKAEHAAAKSESKR